jgi:hypothetical protein
MQRYHDKMPRADSAAPGYAASARAPCGAPTHISKVLQSGPRCTLCSETVWSPAWPPPPSAAPTSAAVSPKEEPRVSTHLREGRGVSN